jgi:hypothetical protein
MSMMAYANPQDIADEKQRADGYGIVRFKKQTREITFECWPRFADTKQGQTAQFLGWPITVAMDANDGRKVVGWLPEIVFEGASNPVVQVIEEATGEILYTVRAQGGRFHPRVYSNGKYTLKLGLEKPGAHAISGLEPKSKAGSGKRILKV